MKLAKSCTALFHGLRFCFTVSTVRSLALWPWFLGLVTYVASVVTAYYCHSLILQSMIEAPQGFWGSALYSAAWVLVAFFLLVGTLIVSVVVVLILTSVFQTAIAARVLLHLGRQVPEETPGLKGIVKEAARSVAVESLKLLWLLPLFLLLFLVGLIPIFTPFAIILAAWLLAFQFVDITLDIYRISSGGRFRFCLRHALPLTCFGLTLTVFWAIPLLGWVLPPAASAAAAWLLSETNLLPGQDAPR
jgi:uncharacterized protein involved in cysteine biosynthesis